MRAKKLLTSRQIFRYAVPARTVIQKHRLYRIENCSFDSTTRVDSNRRAIFSTTTNVDTAQNRAADLPSSALVPFPASSRAAANDAGFTVDESVPRVCVACSLPCQDSSSPRETAPAQANLRRSRAVGRVDKLHAAPE